MRRSTSSAHSRSQDEVHHLARDLEKDPAVIYVLDRNLRIAYCNEAWDRFAAENGGVGLDRRQQEGRAVMDVVPRPLKPFFEDGYHRALLLREIWEHTYECSSGSTFRRFRMTAHPEPVTGGLVVVNSLTVEFAFRQPEPRAAISSPEYVDQHGITTVCCHCRRIRRAGPREYWDWVPSLVERPPQKTSHGICAVCLNLYYAGTR